MDVDICSPSAGVYVQESTEFIDCAFIFQIGVQFVTSWQLVDCRSQGEHHAGGLGGLNDVHWSVTSVNVFTAARPALPRGDDITQSAWPLPPGLIYQWLADGAAPADKSLQQLSWCLPPSPPPSL